MNKPYKFLLLVIMVLWLPKANAAAFTLDYIRYDYNSDRSAIYASGKSTTELYEIVIQPEILYTDGNKYQVEGIGTQAFQKGKQRHVVLHKGLKYVKSQAFENSSQLKSITLPSTLTEIGDNAFANCTKLEHIYASYAAPPTVSSTAFSGSTTSTVLHVPKGCIEAYESKAPWNGFSSIIDDLDAVVPTSANNEEYRFYSDPLVLCTSRRAVEIPFYLKNDGQVTAIDMEIAFDGMSFDGQLPADDIDILTDEYNYDPENPFLLLSDRASGLEPQSGFMIAESPSAAACELKMAGTIEAGDGELFRLVMIPPKAGIYNRDLVYLTCLTLADGSQIELEPIKISLVAQHLEGDMDDDGIIDVMDVSTLINIILDKR